MFQSVPSHLKNLLRGIAASFMGLSCGDLAQVLDVFCQLGVNLLKGVHELCDQVVNLLLTWFVLAYFFKSFTSCVKNTDNLLLHLVSEMSELGNGMCGLSTE